MSIITTSQLKNVEIILPPIERSVEISEIVRTTDLETAINKLNQQMADNLLITNDSINSVNESITSLTKMIENLNEKIEKLQNADLSQDSLIATCITNIANLNERLMKVD